MKRKLATIKEKSINNRKVTVEVLKKKILRNSKANSQPDMFVHKGKGGNRRMLQ